MRGAILLAATLAAGPAAGQVVSTAPDEAAVTIYRLRVPIDISVDDRLEEMEPYEGLAMIRETRTIELPAGRSRISFRGVSDTMVPETAAVEDLPGPTVERNEDYNLLTPGALVEGSLSRTVQLVRTHPKTGVATARPAVLRAGADGPVLEVDGRVEGLGCSGAPERLVFDGLPPGLADKPTFSILADVPAAGRYKVRLSYLATGMGWSADYVARVAADGRTLDLTGWITLANQTSMSLVRAPTDVVAGNLSHEAETAPPEFSTTGLTIQCWPLRRQVAVRGRVLNAPIARGHGGIGAVPGEGLEEIVVTAERRATLSELGDYKLYTLPEPTTVASHQTKQVQFLEQRGVRFERLYAFRYDGDQHDEGELEPATSVLRLKNETKAGLGKPLPAGAVTVMESPGSGASLLVGQWRVRDTAVGLPVELELGRSMDVQVNVDETGYRSGPNGTDWTDIQATFVNDKPVAVTLEYRQANQGDGFKVTKASRRSTNKNGDAMWLIRLPPRGQETLRYRVYSE
ncbi:hypothetical protein [Phenylobacterium sp.]|uniref:DUF4139 domain-containing protein n=1 Tax=Phenylobacterium sp. TaxID=1871053 RepID=UPI002ED8D6BE